MERAPGARVESAAGFRSFLGRERRRSWPSSIGRRSHRSRRRGRARRLRLSKQQRARSRPITKAVANDDLRPVDDDIAKGVTVTRVQLRNGPTTQRARQAVSIKETTEGCDPGWHCFDGEVRETDVRRTNAFRRERQGRGLELPHGRAVAFGTAGYFRRRSRRGGAASGRRAPHAGCAFADARPPLRRAGFSQMREFSAHGRLQVSRRLQPSRVDLAGGARARSRRVFERQPRARRRAAPQACSEFRRRS